MARSFNGTSDVITAALPTTAVTNYTLACWCKTTQLTTGQMVLYNGSSGSNGYGSYIPANSLTPNLLLGGVVDASGTIALTSNAWTHIIVTRATTDHSLFINNNLSKFWNASTNTPTVTMTAGANEGGNFFGGSLAEVAFWVAQLDNAERAALAAGASPSMIRPSALVEYLPMVRANVSYKRAAPTLTGTTVSAHPRIIMPRGPVFRPVIVPAVPPFVVSSQRSVVINMTGP